ncbi:DUF1858 domain-containing protein [Pontiellaceae bacterium B1224]|nr:DUF1858 domain-containing protein [Pontiellaceae bacterium B1224]
MTPIIPSMKVGRLLEEFPELEETLIGLSPQFKKLKNPVLRRTVANIVTLQQAAATGGIPVDQLVNTLRKDAGQPELNLEGASDVATDQPRPDWMDQNREITQLDVTETIQSCGVPLDEVLAAARALNLGQILELIAPLYPAPIVEKLTDEAFKSWSRPDGDQFHIYFFKG